MTDKIIFIYDNISFLTQEDKYEIAKIINAYDSSLINECADGIRVSFKKMPVELINRVHSVVSHKIDKLKITAPSI